MPLGKIALIDRSPVCAIPCAWQNRLAVWVAGTMVARLLAGPVVALFVVVPLPVVFGALFAVRELSRAFIRDERTLRERFAAVVGSAVVMFAVGAVIAIVAGACILLLR